MCKCKTKRAHTRTQIWSSLILMYLLLPEWALKHDVFPLNSTFKQTLTVPDISQSKKMQLGYDRSRRTVCLSFRDFYFPPLAHFHCNILTAFIIMTMRFIHVPGLGPHTAGGGTSVWFCSGLQTSSCLYRSRTERSPPSSGRRHTLHTSSPNAWSGKTNKVWTASTLQVSRENPDCGWSLILST